MTNNVQTALVIGGSRGIGKEIAHKLSARGTVTHVVARTQASLDAMKALDPGINTIRADATDDKLPATLMAGLQPDLLVLCAGATPRMAPLQTQSWPEFSAAWNADVKAAHGFISSALTQPMRPGGTVVSFSSGASLSGSRLSGGYAGAKRMQHFLTEYAQREADDLGLNLRFLSIIPKQLVQGTEKGGEAAAAYAAAVGKPLAQFWSQWDKALTAEGVADHVMQLLDQPAPLPGHAFTITGAGAAALT